jgi:hypothetical protein
VAVDCAGEAIARDAAVGFLFGPFRAPVDVEFDLLFRWFVGVGVDDPVWDHSTFSKNRDRLLAGEIAAKFPPVVLGQLAAEGVENQAARPGTVRDPALLWRKEFDRFIRPDRYAPLDSHRRELTATIAGC